VTVTPFYTRPGLHVDVYDSLHGSGIPGGDDLAFFRRLAEDSGGTVLELGAGTGRLAIPLAAAGIDIVGLDRSRAMLDVAEAKRRSLPREVCRRVSLVEGDMTDLRLGRRFGLVFAAFRVFMALLDPEAQRRALSGIRPHLRPGGLVAIDLFDPRLDRLVPDLADPGELREAVHPATGRRVVVRIGDRVNDPVRQVFRQQWRFTELDRDGTTVREEEEELSLRWTYRWEMRHLLELEGFQPVAEYSDYAMSPPAYGGEQIWVARKAGRR
jgi:SAM-dependent methyltransferase